MKSRLTLESWILSRPIAHRGLHDNNAPENSISAFKCAIDGNYPIEMDVHMTSDNRLLVFHDDNTKRMTGFDGDIRTMSYDEAKKLTLGGTNERIPDFEEFLKLVGGKVPILIEIKNQLRDGIEELIVNALKNYSGDFAIQSFNPFIIGKLRELNPEITRGLLGTKKAENQKLFTRFVLRALPFSRKAKPDFISYNVNDLPLKPIVRRALPLICWTVRNRSDLSRAVTYANNYIFEDFKPVI